MTVDSIYQEFLQDIENEDGFYLYFRVDNLIQKLKRYYLENKSSDMLSLIYTLERSYKSSFHYVKEAPRKMLNVYLPVSCYEQPAIKQAIFKMEDEDYSTIDKVDILVGMMAFSSRVENNISSFEGKKLASYNCDEYIIFGEFLRKITNPYHDWIVPILTSSMVQEKMDDFSKGDSINYLMNIYDRFYSIFFPNGEQDINTFDLFSFIDFNTSDGMECQIPHVYVKQIYSNLNQIDIRDSVKKKEYS